MEGVWLVGWLVVRQLKCLIAAANVEKTVITVIHCRCPIVSSVLTDDGRQRHPTRVCSQPTFFAANQSNFSKNLFLKKPFLQPNNQIFQILRQKLKNQRMSCKCKWLYNEPKTREILPKQLLKLFKKNFFAANQPFFAANQPFFAAN